MSLGLERPCHSLFSRFRKSDLEDLKMGDFTPKFNLKSVKNDKDLRKIRLKLDCPSEVEWERWKPGREHQKTFYVKNILNKVQVRMSMRSAEMQLLMPAITNLCEEDVYCIALKLYLV